MPSERPERRFVVMRGRTHHLLTIEHAASVSRYYVGGATLTRRDAGRVLKEYRGRCKIGRAQIYELVPVEASDAE